LEENNRWLFSRYPFTFGQLSTDHRVVQNGKLVSALAELRRARKRPQAVKLFMTDEEFYSLGSYRKMVSLREILFLVVFFVL
jgi:glutaminase